MTYSGNGKLSRFSFEEKVRLLKIGEYRSSPQGQNRAVGLTPQTQEGTPIEPASAKRAEEEAEEKLMWRQKGKAVSSSGKASYSEPKTLMQPDALVINMRLSPDGFSLGLG